MPSEGLETLHIGLSSNQPHSFTAIVKDLENAAIYLFKPKAFEYGLQMISTDNAEEEYLTDVVNEICDNPTYEVEILKVENNVEFLGFIEKYEDVIKILKKIDRLCFQSF